ncbi:DUF2125 domain-containing protein [Mesorhizobium sp. SP-1A]|uniref:DUF2125 domain-containing protein n=1 Tax=Mesorhizobium sp. SP-1A TaxID=3077840 RepID=UPI0028F6C8F3|nr:DUF2125 domain-containing protein [Mesorhizobium sp. SP-1A]
MTSSDERQPKPRRSLWWLVLLVLLLFGLYSAGWFWLAERVRNEADNAVLALNTKGIQAACANMQVSGYPLRFNVSCDSMAYEDDAHSVAASAGKLNAVAGLPRPWLSTAEIGGPLRMTAPGMAPLWIDWDRLNAEASLSWPLPRGVTLDAEGLSGQTDPADDSDPVQLFSVGNATAELRPQGQDLDYAGRFSDLEIDPQAIGGRTVPPLNGSGAATLKNGVVLLAAVPKTLRGQAAQIANLELSSGEARVSVSGPVSVGADGLIDADLTIALQNPKAVAEVLAGAIPEKADQIRQGFAALALLGNKPTMPLRIVKGKASLGFIRLGDIKPVD